MALLSPGFEIKESSLQSTTSSGSTGRGGMVGQFQWGPAFQITQITNEADLINRFGRPDDVTASSFFTASNFLIVGNDLRVVRVVDEDTAKNASTVGGVLKILNESTVGEGNGGYGATIAHIQDPMNAPGAYSITGTTVTFIENSETNVTPITGSYAVVIYTDPVTGDELVFDDESNPIIGMLTVDGQGVIDGTRIAVDGIKKLMTLKGETDLSRFKIEVQGKSGVGAVLTPIGLNADSGIYFASEETGTDAMYATGPESILELSKEYLMPTISAAYPGGYGDNITVAIVNKADWDASKTEISVERFPGGTWEDIRFRQLLESGPQTADQYGIVVYLGSTIVETHLVSTKPGDTDIYGNVIYIDTYFTNGNSNYIFASDANWATHSGIYSLAGGVDLQASASEFIEGYEYFADGDSIYVNLLMTGSSVHLGEEHTIIANNALSIANARRDVLAIIEPPLSLMINKKAGDAVADIVDWRNDLSTDTSFAMYVGNAKYQYDRYNDVKRWVPLSGDVAGLCVYTDQVEHPWNSPAGFNRGQIPNVARLAFDTKQAHRDVLYEAQLNPVVAFSGRGTILYGDKTATAVPSAFNRINVRRLFNMVEKAVGNNAQYKLFENNTVFTRSSWKSETDSYLDNIKSLGGIIDFITVCDESNNTAQVIDANQFVGTVYIKPPKSINFITLNFVATDSGVTMEELV